MQMGSVYTKAELKDWEIVNVFWDTLGLFTILQLSFFKVWNMFGMFCALQSGMAICLSLANGVWEKALHFPSQGQAVQS